MNLPTATYRELIPVVASSTDEIIRVNSISVAYRGKMALTNVTMTIRSGRIAALIGPSGCGKTSLLTCMNRLIDLVPGAAVTGQIYLQGKNVLSSGANVLSLRKRVGMVFQRPNPFPFSIRRNFDLVLAEAGYRTRSDREAQMIRCLCAVGLYDEIGGRLNSLATDLSGGQQQRLCIARALATEPDILLLDEPCSALDPISTMAIEQLLSSLKERMTLVIVTHNLPQARRLADDCALFWTRCGSGFLLEQGTMSEMVARPAHQITADYIHGRLA